MASLLEDTWETYAGNIKLVLLFSIPFIIAFLIPLFAPLPTYVSSGGIFLRSASIFLNVTVPGMVVIIISSFLSLLFLSFAFVAISLIVKAKRTYTKHAGSVLRDVEKYTARVFAVLLAYAFILTLVNITGYFFGLEEIVTPIVGFILFMAIFYAPTAIVIDNKRVGSALDRSMEMVAKEPQYFILWVVLLTVVVSVVDYAVIHAADILLPSFLPFTSYLVLLLNSLFILPYFIIFQAEAYMKRFPVLRH
jgi:hypothetical protein